MQIFLSIAGPILAESSLYEKIQGKSKGRAAEGTGGELETGTKSLTKESSMKKSLPGFDEGDEDDEY